MVQQPTPAQASRVGRDGRYKPNVNDLDQFDQSRHEHDDRDVWRPRKSQGGYRQETQPQHLGERGGFRDRGTHGGAWQHRPDRGDRDFHRQNPGQYGRRSYDPREAGIRSQEGDRRTYDNHPGRRRSRERSPHRPAHPRSDRSEPRQAQGAAPPDAHEGRHQVAQEGLRKQQQQQHSHGHHAPGGPPIRMNESRYGQQGPTQAGQVATNANNSEQQQQHPDRPMGGRNSWGQQGSKRHSDPFAGGGKWKHDGFEELQKQQDEPKGPADSKPGAAVAAPS